jgi:glycosyltransferase involved in cell wall biosynthesis
MKIATMVRGYIPAPRPADIVYAPIDLSINISEGLVARGHSVDYFGPNGTHLEANVETMNLRPLIHNMAEFRSLIESADLMTHYIPGLWDGFLVREMFERAQRGEYDLLHFHHPEVAFPYVKLYPDVPVVYTLHESLTPWYREVLEMYDTPSQYYISISNNQRIPAPDLSYISTVYNGTDTNLFSFSAKHEDYLLSVGRIVPEKGIKEAIQVAQQTNNRLLIIGPTYPDQQDYFDQHVKPHLNDKIVYLGFIAHADLPRYFQNAKAFLMPIQWEEPFGLTMTEAMACGTPVIALRRGSVPEVLVNNKTGFIVNSIAEMVKAVGKIDTIKPRIIREHVEVNFSIAKMVEGYEAAFTNVLKKHKRAQKGPAALVKEKISDPLKRKIKSKK